MTKERILFYKKTACVSASGSVVCGLFICRTVPEQNLHIITAGIENAVDKNFTVVSTVEADVISAYNKAVIALYPQSKIAEYRPGHGSVKYGDS